MNPRKRLLLRFVSAVVLIAGIATYLLLSRGLAIGLWAQRNTFAKMLERQTVDSATGPQTVFANTHTDAPTLVLVHGFGDQAATWSQLAKEMGDHYRLVAPDLSGHGSSAPRGSALSYDELYQGLEATIAATTAGSRIVLIGNSLGGWLSMRYALDHPEKVERLILINAAGLSQKIDKQILIPQTRDALEEKMDRMFPAEAQPRLPGFALDQLIAMTDLPRFDALFDSLEDSTPLDAQLHRLETPTDLIWGTPDGFFPLDYARRLQSAIPGAQLHQLENCGHVPQMVCSDRLVVLIGQILHEPAAAGQLRGQLDDDSSSAHDFPPTDGQ